MALDFSKVSNEEKERTIERFIKLLNKITAVSSLDNIVYGNYMSKLDENFYEVKVKNLTNTTNEVKILTFTIFKKTKQRDNEYFIDGTLKNANTSNIISFSWHESYKGLDMLFSKIEEKYKSLEFLDTSYNDIVSPFKRLDTQ